MSVVMPTMPVPVSANAQFAQAQLVYFRHVQRLSSGNQLLSRVLAVTQSGVCYVCSSEGLVKSSFHPLQIHTAELRADGRSLLLRFKSSNVSDLYFVFNQSLERDQINPLAATREYFVEVLVRLSVDSVHVRDEKSLSGRRGAVGVDVAALAARGGARSDDDGGGGVGADADFGIRNVKKKKSLTSSGASFMSRLLRGLTMLRDQNIRQQETNGLHTAKAGEMTSGNTAIDSSSRGSRKKDQYQAGTSSLRVAPHMVSRKHRVGSEPMKAFLIEVPATMTYPKKTFTDVLFFRRGVLLELINAADKEDDEKNKVKKKKKKRAELEADRDNSLAELLRPKRRRGLLMLRQDGTFFFDTNWQELGEDDGAQNADDGGGRGILRIPTELTEVDLLEKLFLHVSQIEQVSPLIPDDAKPATSLDDAAKDEAITMTGGLQIRYDPVVKHGGGPQEGTMIAKLTFDRVSASLMNPGDEACSCVAYLQRLVEYLRPDLASSSHGNDDAEFRDVKNGASSNREAVAALQEARDASLKLAQQTLSQSRSTRRSRGEWLLSEQAAAKDARAAASRAIGQARTHAVLSQLVFQACQVSISRAHAEQRGVMLHSTVPMLPAPAFAGGPTLVSRNAPLDRVGLSEQRKDVAKALFHLL